MLIQPATSFSDRFRFNTSLTGMIGLEEECFIVNENGQPVPEAPRVLEKLTSEAGGHDHSPFGYELSACQIELRTLPSEPTHVVRQLQHLRRRRDHVIRMCGYGTSLIEVGPANMSLDVYPDPLGRYQRIARTKTKEELQAACRSIGTHLHFGLPDPTTAIRVYNHVIAHVRELSELGDGSRGERLRLYRIVEPNCDPAPYSSWHHFEADAHERGFHANPRDNWKLIRISAHGTLEARVFGTTRELTLIDRWIRRFHELCMEKL